MGKKKILLIKVNALVSDEQATKLGNKILNNIRDYGILLYDDGFTVREVEVDGVEWEKENG